MINPSILKALKILSQPSSMAGFASLAVIVHISAPQFQAITSAIAGVCAILAVVFDDGSNTSIPENKP